MKHFRFLLLFSLFSYQTYAQSAWTSRNLSVFAGLWPGSLAMSGDAYQAAGIQQEYRLVPVFLGVDYALPLNRRWQYFLSAQVSPTEIVGYTTLESPQPLSPGLYRLETVSYDQRHWQGLAGGGLHYYAIARREVGLRLNAALFGAYTQTSAAPGRGIQLPDPSGSTLIYGGEVQHEVYRSIVPVGRLGAGVHYRPLFAPRFTVGAELYYYGSPDFVRGSWTRDQPGTTTLGTSGTYQGGFNHLIMSLQASFSF
jgi:hypothetical protein